MLDINMLREFGADVDDGLNRCMNNEEFYLKLVTKASNDDTYLKLRDYLNNKDLDKAFEIAHYMKGLYTNLSLDPISKPVIEITELLRERKDIDYSDLIDEIESKINIFKTIIKV